MKKIAFIKILFLLFIINANASNLIDVKFERCIDGDTAAFKYKNEIITVRFLAIDTPEVYPKNNIQPYGIEASNYTCTKIKNAQNLKLEYDEESDKLDKYKRHLAWIWIDDHLLQKDLIELGLAEVKYIYGDYKYLDKLYKLEKTAKANNVGIWKKFKVTFIIDKDEKVIEIKPGEKIEMFTPKKKGYIFLSWNNNNKKFDFNKTIESDLILEAVFKKDHTKTIVYLSFGFIIFLSLIIFKKTFK